MHSAIVHCTGYYNVLLDGTWWWKLKKMTILLVCVFCCNERADRTTPLNLNSPAKSLAAEK
jgi:hypothetical protein